MQQLFKISSEFFDTEIVSSGAHPTALGVLAHVEHIFVGRHAELLQCSFRHETPGKNKVKARDKKRYGIRTSPFSRS